MIREGVDDGYFELKNQERLKSGKCLQNLFTSTKEISISK